MLQIHATLHAASHLFDVAVEPLSADLDELLAVHEQLGRAASSELVGEMSLTAQIVRSVLPAERLIGCAVPVIAAPGQQPLKVERSRPEWFLNGTVRGVPWSTDVERLVVFAIDEGDNDVLVLLPPGSARVEITPTSSAHGTVDICFDDVSLPTVAHCPGVPGALADGLTVLTLARVIGAVDWLLTQTDRRVPRGRAELELCRASLRAAAASLTSSSVVRRQHDVSAAALLVLPTCLRVAEAVATQDDPEVRLRVEHIRQRVHALPQWHSVRLHALV